jgi:hypothetical protein
MNNSNIQFILPILAVSVWAAYRYFLSRNSKEKVYRLGSPIFLMLSILSLIVGVFMFLYTIELIR